MEYYVQVFGKKRGGSDSRLIPTTDRLTRLTLRRDKSEASVLLTKIICQRLQDQKVYRDKCGISCIKLTKVLGHI